MKTIRQREVGCSVPHCEADWCDRERKKGCALRKYYLYEVVDHKARMNKLLIDAGVESASSYQKKHFFWRFKDERADTTTFSKNRTARTQNETKHSNH